MIQANRFATILFFKLSENRTRSAFELPLVLLANPKNYFCSLNQNETKFNNFWIRTSKKLLFLE